MLFKFILNVCCFYCTFVQKLFKSACFLFEYKSFHSVTPLWHCTADHSHLSATDRCALREALYKLIDRPTIQYLSHSSSGVRALLPEVPSSDVTKGAEWVISIILHIFFWSGQRSSCCLKEGRQMTVDICFSPFIHFHRIRTSRN